MQFLDGLLVDFLVLDDALVLVQEFVEVLDVELVLICLLRRSC